MLVCVYRYDVYMVISMLLCCVLLGMSWQILGLTGVLTLLRNYTRLQKQKTSIIYYTYL